MYNADYLIRTVGTVLSSLDDYIRAVINTTPLSIKDRNRLIQTIDVVQQGCIKIDDIMRNGK